MRISDPRPFMDAVLEPQDEVEVELVPGIKPGSKVLYVNVNGVTVLRLGRVTKIKGI